MSIHFKLVTPERVLFEEEVASVTIPTANGEITVLPNHIPLVAKLAPGVAVLTRPDGAVEDVAISEGFIHINEGSQVIVLAETAERGAELELSVIEAAKARAEAAMKEQVHATDESFAEAAAALERELARYRAAERHIKRHGHAGGPKLIQE